MLESTIDAVESVELDRVAGVNIIVSTVSSRAKRVHSKVNRVNRVLEDDSVCPYKGKNLL